MQTTKYLILFIALFYCLSFQLSVVESVTCAEDPTDATCIDCTTDPNNDECTTTTTTTTEATTTTTTTTTTAASTTADTTTTRTPTKAGPKRKRFRLKMNYKTKRVIKVKKNSG